MGQKNLAAVYVKECSAYTMEYYSAIRRNEFVPFAETWMDLETVIQSEVGQKEKTSVVY